MLRLLTILMPGLDSMTFSGQDAFRKTSVAWQMNSLTGIIDLCSEKNQETSQLLKKNLKSQNKKKNNKKNKKKSYFVTSNLRQVYLHF
jgi:hypothetical protein